VEILKKFHWTNQGNWSHNQRPKIYSNKTQETPRWLGMRFESTASNGTNKGKGNGKKNLPNGLTAVPHAGDASVAHLLLQLEDTVHQSLGGRGAWT
jgi:hypothetical protein